MVYSCPCKKCNGAEVSYRTLKRHEENRDNADVEGFTTWLAANEDLVEQYGGDDESSETEDSSKISSEEETDKGNYAGQLGSDWIGQEQEPPFQDSDGWNMNLDEDCVNDGSGAENNTNVVEDDVRMHPPEQEEFPGERREEGSIHRGQTLPRSWSSSSSSSSSSPSSPSPSTSSSSSSAPSSSDEDGEDRPRDPGRNRDYQEYEADLEQDRAAAAATHGFDDSETEDEEEGIEIYESLIEHVKLTQEYISLVSQATLDDGTLPASIISLLRDPVEPSDADDLNSPVNRLSLDLYLACNNASEATYNGVCTAISRSLPNSAPLSLYSVRTLIASATGIVDIRDDMCVNSCHAFTGPLAELDACQICSQPRFNPAILERTGKEVPRKEACTIPLGPQLQALRRSATAAQAMRYQSEKTQAIFEALNSEDPNDIFAYDDIFSGNDYLHLCENLDLTEDDTSVLFFLDGAQLYRDKKSDTWIGVWIVANYDPQTRYKKKHILPALIVPGPSKPKILDSFLFRSFCHLSALQREVTDGIPGIRVWDAVKEDVISSRIIFLLGTADAIGLTEMDGRVGHHGAHGCRIGCDMKGRHKPRTGHYYAAHLRPHGRFPDCNHQDFDFRDPDTLSRGTGNQYHENLTKIVSSQTQAEYERNRKLTGLSKPSLLSGLKPEFMLPVPQCFSVDLMHLLFLNLGELFIPLWRGTFKCHAPDQKATWDWATLTGDVWIEHRKLVAAATPYFPASFHRPPRNPEEKISSGYKATEYFLYLFGLGPGFFRAVLPDKYWRHFCKLVRGVRCIIQRKITDAQLQEAHSFLVQFVEEYELMYYQRRMDRLHFCRPCLHTLLHTAPETTRVGPGAYSTGFTMERAIGDLGRSIRQPSNPFGNLCQLAVRYAQVNALKVLYPELDKDLAKDELPKYSYDLGNGYVLLRPRDRYVQQLQNSQRDAVMAELEQGSVRRWGRLRLPNGQIARSRYSEDKRTSENKRVSRNVKGEQIKRNGKIEYGEVQFYFLAAHEDDGNELVSHALVSLYGPPNQSLLEDSYHTLWASKYLGADSLQVIPTSIILSVVSMQPLPRKDDDILVEDLWFVIEKSGIDDMELIGIEDDE